MNAHALYARLNTAHGEHKVRLSGDLTFDQAIALHESLHLDETGKKYVRPICWPGYSVYGRSVAVLEVRSTDDPNYPADSPVLGLTDDEGKACWTAATAW